MSEHYGYATVDEIMHVYGVSRSYIYRLACQRKWGRYRHPDGGIRYRRDHVHETLGGRTRQRRSRQVKFEPDDGKVSLRPG